MIPTALDEIEAAALQLTHRERTHLTERLLMSLEDDDEIQTAWVEEATRRGDAYAQGQMKAIDFDVSMVRLNAIMPASPSFNSRP